MHNGIHSGKLETDWRHFSEDDILYTANLDPVTFFITSSDLDFTIVACDASPLPVSIEAIPLLQDPQTVTRNERVNIIQHPRGRRKELTLHDNKVTYVYDKGIRYTADTEPGSSGSPVFNNEWDLVALHHAGWSEADGSAVNEGIRIAAIVDFLINRQDNVTDSHLYMLIENMMETNDLNVGATPVIQKAVPSNLKPRCNKSLILNLEGNLQELTIRLG